MTERLRGPAGWSLRKRLLASVLLLTGCGLVVADVAGIVLLRSYQLARLDEQLAFPFGQDQTPSALPLQLCRRVAAGREAPQLPTTYTVTITDQKGVLLCRLPSQPGPYGAPDLGGYEGERLAALAATSTPQTRPSAGAGPGWRVKVVALDRGYAILAASLGDLEATGARLTAVMVAVGGIILGLTVVGGLVLVRVGLRPLTRIEQTAADIAGGDLSRRVEAGAPDTEVGRLAAALNAMLAQIERAFADREDSEERLRRFVADASHELRTPLATVRGHAELFRQGAVSSPEETAVVLSRIESEAERMGKLVENLLLLTRMDSVPTVAQVPVDLLSVAADAVVDARAQAPGRSTALVRITDPPWLDVPPIVRADEATLRQIVANLLANALQHTPPASPIEIVVGVTPAVVELRVVDHGGGLAPETAERVFERFYRADPGRSRENGGAGLGLSIVASLVAANRGSVRTEPTPGGGATFVVTLPALPLREYP